MYSNRLDLFKGLAVNELEHTIYEETFDKLLDSKYVRFVELWEYVDSRRNEIDKVSVFLNDDNLHFEINFLNGKNEIIWYIG